MRETRNAQTSIFDFYAEHEQAQHLRALSKLLDQHPVFLHLVEPDFDRPDVKHTGARGLSLESIFRCLLLKQMLGISYEKLSFHLSDSPTYRTFTRLRDGRSPSKSALQATVRRIRANTLQQINQQLMLHCFEQADLSMDSVRIDSTVVDSNILSPNEGQLLADGLRVLSRLMSNSKKRTGVKLRFVDQRKRSRSLAFRIFHAKRAEKQVLYPKLLTCMSTVLQQIKRGIEKVNAEAADPLNANNWIAEAKHFRTLSLRLVDQTQRRVFLGESVPPSEKMVSLFEPHTAIIVKGQRDVQYGHKINLATQADGFVTYMNIESGNPSDRSLYLPVLDASMKDYGQVPTETVADGGYASQRNVTKGRERGVDRTVFNKRCGLGFHNMGVKKKTFERLRDFRAGVEGNISELKRVYKIGKATWKDHDGFCAYVWACTLTYNLMRLMRFSSA